MPTVDHGHHRCGSPLAAIASSLWASKPGAQHSRNISVRPAVSFVVFDSTVRPGTGTAGTSPRSAEPVADADFERALATYSEESIRQGLPVWTESDVREPSRHRLYQATATEAFVLDETTNAERSISRPDAIMPPDHAGGRGTEGQYRGTRLPWTVTIGG